MTFDERMRIAGEHEQRVLEGLLARDWTADMFGQGQMPEHQRANLRDYVSETGYPTPIRWMPDIIGSKRFANRAQVIFIDAKAGDTYKRTGNHDLEQAAVESAEGWAMFARCPYYFVFQDGGVLTPEDVRERGKIGTFRGNGSGTPFYLVPVEHCRPFDAVFGAKSRDAA